uniref:SAP domain-containing protein n=1 Tax=Strongyloides papillosus TaxID=174720 RepID=A0A0N5BLF6_STREA
MEGENGTPLVVIYKEKEIVLSNLWKTLVAACKQLKLASSGTKAELAKRLVESGEKLEDIGYLILSREKFNEEDLDMTLSNPVTEGGKTPSTGSNLLFENKEEPKKEEDVTKVRDNVGSLFQSLSVFKEKDNVEVFKLQFENCLSMDGMSLAHEEAKNWLMLKMSGEVLAHLLRENKQLGFMSAGAMLSLLKRMYSKKRSKEQAADDLIYFELKTDNLEESMKKLQIINEDRCDGMSEQETNSFYKTELIRAMQRVPRLKDLATYGRHNDSRQRTEGRGGSTGAKVKAPGNKIVCFICGLENHKLFACPTKKSSKSSEKDASKVRRIVDRSTGLIILTSINFPEGEVKVLDVYIDTGADMTLVSEELASRLITHEEKVKLQFGGEDRWEGKVFIVSAAVVPTAIMISTNYTHILLGSDSIKKMSARIACQETAPSITIRRQAKVSVPESQIKVFDKEVPLLAKEYPDLITDKKEELGILSYIVELLEFITKEMPEIVKYAVSSAKEEIISKECQSLINLKVLQPCLTPRFIRNLVVAYKNDKLRVCVDIRRLNTCVKKIATYISTPNVIISKLCGANFFLQVNLQAEEIRTTKL